MLPSGNPKYRALKLVAFLAVFALAFFRLPFFFPVPPSVSASYVFQYNNRVATLIFIAGAAALAILFRGLSLQPATRDSRISRTSAFVAMVACLLAVAFSYWVSIPFGLHGESVYFYSRLAKLAAGKTIYRQFEFAYGPLLLYPELWISRLFHLSLINGYIVFLLFCWAVGIWILYRLINAIDIPSPYRTAVFFLLVLEFAVGAIWPLGVNYAPLRGLLTAGLALVVLTVYKRTRSPIVAAAVSVSCAALATAVSPEHGIAFMLGSGLFFVFCVRSRPRGYWPALAAMGIGFLAIVLLSAQAEEYITLRAFSVGSYSYPIMPTPDVLCVLALFLVAACIAYLCFKQRKTESLVIYLLCICIFGLPSSFGRADSGHMQIAAFSAVVIAMLALGRYPKIALLAAVAYLGFIISSPFSANLGSVRESIERRAFDPVHQSPILHNTSVFILHAMHEDAHLQVIEAKDRRLHQDDILQTVSELPPGIVDSPFYGQSISDTSGRIDYGYYSGLENVTLPSQVQSIIQWLQSHPDRKILLSNMGGRDCYKFDEGDSAAFRTVYGIHYASPKRRMPVYFPLCEFVGTHYRPDAVPFSSVLRLWHTVPATGKLEPSFVRH